MCASLVHNAGRKLGSKLMLPPCARTVAMAVCVAANVAGVSAANTPVTCK